MRFIKNTVCLLLFCLMTAAVGRAQTLFEHTALPANTNGHITTIDHESTNGKPNAVLLISQVYGVYNPNEIGVWYNAGKWTVFNQNKQAMPANARFNVLVLGSDLGMVHTATAANTSGHITTLDGLTDPNLCILVTQHFGQYNTSPVGVWYNGGKWKIYNENRAAIPAGTKFNLTYLKENPGLKLGTTLEAGVFLHKVNGARNAGHVSYLDNAACNDKPGKRVFATQRYIGDYNANATGVWYDAGKWTVFNQNRQAMPGNAAFNVFALAPVLRAAAAGRETMIRTTPAGTEKLKTTDAGKIAANPAATNYKINPALLKNVNTLKINPGQWVIKPYTPTKTEEKPAGTAPSTDIEGPNIALPQNLTTLVPEPGYASFIGALNLFRELYEDKNRHSNTYYYLPANYNLRWSRDNGQYSFFIYYLSASGGGRGDVIITAELSPGINAGDIALAEKLLSKKLNRPIKLLPMPLKDTPKLSFGNILTNFGVKNESVTINIPTDFLQPIVVSWKMDQRVDDLLGAMMSQLLLSGNVEFTPYAADDKVISVPLKLKINDPATLGKLEFENAEALFNGLNNRLDFPMTLSRINVLRNHPSQVFTVESFPLGAYEILPKNIFSSFSENEKTRVLNGPSIGKIWVDYALKDCPDCNQAVQQKILGGTSTTRMKPVNVEILTPVKYLRDSLQGSHLKFRIKSKQGDPNGRSEVVFPFVDIREDDKTLTVGELMVPEGGGIELEYQAFLVLLDGSSAEGPWIKGNEDFVTLGLRQIKEWFSDPKP